MKAVLASASPDLVGFATFIILFAVALGVYFLPSIIAVWRSHPNSAAIFILNFLLGWTFVGWAGALIWCATAIDESRRYR